MGWREWIARRARSFLAHRRDGLANWRGLSCLLWRADPARTIAVVVLAIAQGLTPIVVLLETGRLVGAVPEAVRLGADSPAGHEAILALALIGVALVVSAILDAIGGYLAVAFDSAYARTLHDTIARSTLGTPGIAELEDPELSGEIAAFDEYERIRSFLGLPTALRWMIVERTVGVIALVILFASYWWAPFVLLAAWRATAWGIRRVITYGFEIGFGRGTSTLRRARYLRTLLVEPAAAKEIRVFGLAGWLSGTYADTWLGSMRPMWRGRAREWTRGTGISAVIVLAYGLVLGVAGHAALVGVMSAATLVVIAQAVVQSNAVGWTGDGEAELSEAGPFARRVLGLERRLASGPSDPVGGGRADRSSTPSSAHDGPMAVRLEAVRFGYPGRDRATLDALELEVPAGQSLAIVGENGAGKTTLIKLLCGLYQPDAGRIRLDGSPPLEARHRVGVIFQDFVRYELPLRDNVAFGAIGTDPAFRYDEERLARVAADAGLGELPTRLPKGWDTPLSGAYENGQDLSGGQWQKVALARALAAVRGGAGLLILDEPTAALDVRAETELFDRFLDLTANVTTILVSHRLASVRHADRIVVLADGRVVEDGSHDELMALGTPGRYARMFSLQAERFATDAQS